MATLIASLKEQLSDRDNILTDLKGQVTVLEEKVSSNATKSLQTINGLEAQITEKNNNIQSLTTALQTLQSTPAAVQNCPEVTVAAGASDDNNPIIKYLEGKNAELTKQLENCGKGADKTPKTAKPKNQSLRTLLRLPTSFLRTNGNLVMRSNAVPAATQSTIKHMVMFLC